jgi:hypothetical protein
MGQRKAAGAAKAATASMAPAAAPKAPRLVGDSTGPALPPVEQPVEPDTVESEEDQGGKPEAGAEIIAPGNSERLGLLGREMVRLYQFMTAMPAFVYDAKRSVVDNAIEGIQSGKTSMASLVADMSDLDKTLLARPGFAYAGGETMPAATIRVIGDLDLSLAASVSRLGVMEALIADLTADPETGAGALKAKKDLGKAVRSLAELFEDLPDTAAITLRFADGDEFLRTVPPRAVDRAELVAAGSRVSLNARIEFDPGLPAAQVTAAFLIAGKKTLRCAVGPLRIGGGAQACIPAGFLEF